MGDESKMMAVREEHTALKPVVGGHRDRYVGSTLETIKEIPL